MNEITAESVDRQIKRSVIGVVRKLASGEPLEDGELALALAAGETAASLAKRVNEKLERRAAPRDASGKVVKPAKVEEPAKGPQGEELAKSAPAVHTSRATGETPNDPGRSEVPQADAPADAPVEVEELPHKRTHHKK